MSDDPILLKVFDDGTIGEVYPMTYGKARLYHSRPIGKFNSVIGGWCYDSPLAAAAALAVWDGVDLPVGWFRDTFTGEIRPENTKLQLTSRGPNEGTDNG